MQKKFLSCHKLKALKSFFQFFFIFQHYMNRVRNEEMKIAFPSANGR